MAVKKRVTMSGHMELLAFWFFSLVNHHGAGFEISQSTSSIARQVRTHLLFNAHISPTAK
jgi:hypothetical protein